MSVTTCPDTGGTPGRTLATTPSIGSITMSATTCSTTPSPRTTDSSEMTVTDPRLDGGEVSGADFRHAIGHFATGVTVVPSVDADGQPVGTTANAVSSLSLAPPLIQVCFDRSSRTLESVLAHGAFAVNVLGARQQHLSANFARRGLAAAWDGVRHRRGRTGRPRLAGGIARPAGP